MDLFAGMGGLTEGLKQAGFRVVAAVENDPLAVESYERNHPEVRVWDCSIRHLPAVKLLRELRLEPGELDLLAGCPPCQGFSRMTTLNGKHQARDPRNALVFDFVRFVRALRPKAIMLENVPGLGRPHRQAQLIRPLARMGYRVTTAILDAADYGVPQRRKRFVLVGSLRGPLGFAPPARRRRTVREAFATMGVRSLVDPAHTNPQNRSARITRLIARIPANGGNLASAGVRYQLPCHKNFDGFRDVYGRMAWDDVAPTITGGCFNPSKGRFLHPSKNRNISLREAAVLQSFRPSYFISLRQGKCAAAQMIGNALPPEFVRRHAIVIARAIQQEIAETSTDTRRRKRPGLELGAIR